MHPSESFWSGIGTAVGGSPGWMVVSAILIIGVLFIVAKYIMPSRERVKMRRLDIDEKQAQNDSERIKANAMLAEQQRQTNVLIEGMSKSLDASTAHTDVLVAELHESRSRSHEMGGKVDRIDKTASHIDETTSHTAEQVDEMHRILMRRREVTD